MWYLYDVGKQTLKKWKFASANLEINLGHWYSAYGLWT